jgi:hypothetical protein
MEGKIVAISGIKDFEGSKSAGFRIEGQDRWFNIRGDEESINLILKDVVQKGNKVSFKDELGICSEFTLIEKAEKDSFSDDLVNFEELLTFAHEKAKEEKSNLSISTEKIEIDLEKKFAVFKAVVTTKNQRFEAHGDSTSENIQGSFVKPHFIRMAETRAIARALRWYTNNAQCSDVETSKTK